MLGWSQDEHDSSPRPALYEQLRLAGHALTDHSPSWHSHLTRPKRVGVTQMQYLYFKGWVLTLCTLWEGVLAETAQNENMASEEPGTQ